MSLKRHNDQYRDSQCSQVSLQQSEGRRLSIWQSALTSLMETSISEAWNRSCRDMPTRILMVVRPTWTTSLERCKVRQDMINPQSNSKRTKLAHRSKSDWQCKRLIKWRFSHQPSQNGSGNHLPKDLDPNLFHRYEHLWLQRSSKGLHYRPSSTRKFKERVSLASPVACHSSMAPSSLSRCSGCLVRRGTDQVRKLNKV